MMGRVDPVSESAKNIGKYEEAQEEAFKKSRLEQSNCEAASTEQSPKSNKNCD